MGTRHHLGTAALTLIGATVLVGGGLATPASAVVADGSARAAVDCIVPTHADEADAARGHGAHGTDHRSISAAEQARIERRTQARLDRLGKRSTSLAAAATVPVYFHVMRDANGGGDVTDQQIADQVAVMNASFAGQGSTTAASTGFSFSLAGTYRYNNTQWHQDKQSSTYRKQTRKGGKNALNVWLVDFSYLGIATFPWDYARNPGIDGIRVQYSSLPGGSATNYDLGQTATHEAGHWFGLYHTFQGGCTSTNDEVSDTPAQASSTSGCPAGRDSCSLPGLDPIHNFMDYSYDACYTEFTPGQASRAQQMWTAYRA
ncbi:zinc metalloprotease [Nocardioides sp. SOB77]|uniref:Zinc metalloprotease n=1 Tax=Nocardioides oceani TaxID=3058369 RepID=A0ABT8FDY8_9ACTN|nr:zinc metalloprotease [Nocardioides oceani]MDN4172897.1 zinc metalloprotease [Nocardioides oceani]